MKSVHKVLHLHQHKHTGKILAHKHTSYRVLFLLMLVPIIAMALVDHLSVSASDLMVKAKVPAPIPAGAPAILSPPDGATINSRQITVSGTCPVITPAVIIAIYDNAALAGSGSCSATGEFSVPISLSYGVHSLVATVVTITDDFGESSAPITVTITEPTQANPSSGTSGNPLFPNVNGFNIPLRIITKDIFALIDPEGKVTWKGSFDGGQAPYDIEINWGDGTTDTKTVDDNSEQTFTHTYATIQLYDIVIKATDDRDDTATMHIAGVTQFIRSGTAGLDAGTGQVHPVVVFVQKHVWQIYIGTLSALIFLWYLEHGRHLSLISQTVGKKRLRPHKH